MALIQTRRFEVTVFAGVLYTGLKIHVPDDYGFVTAGTVAGVPSAALPLRAHTGRCPGRTIDWVRFLAAQQAFI